MIYYSFHSHSKPLRKFVLLVDLTTDYTVNVRRVSVAVGVLCVNPVCTLYVWLLFFPIGLIDVFVLGKCEK